MKVDPFNARLKPKYRNIQTNGYASKAEAKRAVELKLLESAGQIQDLQEQVKFEIIPKQKGERAAHYVADFVYTRNGEQVVEDVKGVKTPAYVLKRKLMLLGWGISIMEIA